MRAAELGYPALALTDHDGVYGSLEFAHAAKALGLRAITGAEVTLNGGAHVTLLVESQRGYANLCRLLTESHARERLQPALELARLEERNEGLVCLSGCARQGLAVRDPNAAARLARAFGRERFYVELQRPFLRGDARRTRPCGSSPRPGRPHGRHRRRPRAPPETDAPSGRARRDPAEDVAGRLRAGAAGKRRVRAPSPPASGRTLPRRPGAVTATVELAERLEFDLTAGARLPLPGLLGRLGTGRRAARTALPPRVRGSVPPLTAARRKRGDRACDEELALIADLGLSGFFLLHWEVLELAREVALEVRGRGSPRHPLPPGRGRGSSVGSIVCYLTGLSHVDPVAAGLPLGRFLNRELASVPDIDLDFPRDIREKLIVAVTERYGHEHAALVATFATYRSRGAIREVGKALGLPPAELERLARVSEGWDARAVGQELALLPDARREASLAALAGVRRALRGDRGPPAPHLAAPGRNGHLHAPARRARSGRARGDGGAPALPVGQGLVRRRRLPQDRPARPRHALRRRGVRRRDRPPAAASRSTSPASRSTTRPSTGRSRTPTPSASSRSRAGRRCRASLRTRPENLDDLTVQVALVRPGRSRAAPSTRTSSGASACARTPPTYRRTTTRSLAEPLAETLGVVVFQEQVLEVAIALAGFTVGEAEGLRRAMSRKRSRDAIEAYRQRFLDGAAANGVPRATAERVFGKALGFASFGFPKSHAAAFALLAYQSAWLRHHYPAEFLCALLNAQPMGFYPPASLVRDGQRRGIEVLPPDVNASDATCRLEGDAVRVGLAYVKGVGEEPADRARRGTAPSGPFRSVQDLAQRAPLDRPQLEALVASGACDSFGWPRRQLLWRLGLVAALCSARRGRARPPARAPARAGDGDPRSARAVGLGADARRLPHDVALGRRPPARAPAAPSPAEVVVSSADLDTVGHRERIAVAGLVVARQRPATANGVVFMLLEDEHGQVNLIVPPPVYERYRASVRGEPLLLARGRFERVERNRNVVVEELASLAPLARRVADDTEVRASLPSAHSFGRR